MNEDHATRLKRLKMRSMRRGIKEMDLILSQFADTHLDQMPPATLDVYEALLNENDQDLYTWVTEQQTPPERFENLLKIIRQAFKNKS